MNHKEIAHRWAHQNWNQRGDGDLKGGNMFADKSNQTIYSYGYHFPIARHTGNKLAPVLYTSKGYSNTTAKHKSTVWGACHHLDPITVDNVMADSPHDHAVNVAELVEGIIQTIGKWERARTYKAIHAEKICRVLADVERYRKAFKVPLKSLPTDTRKTLQDLNNREQDWIAIAENNRKEAAEIRAKEEQDRIEAARESLERWKAGEVVRLPYLPGPAFLRVRCGNVETSQGASAPVSSAYKLVRMLRLVVEGKITPDQLAGAPVGSYKVNSVTPSGNLLIGCHRFNFEEVERVAPAMRQALQDMDQQRTQ